MSVQAAQRIGLRCLVLDPDKDCPAGQLADTVARPTADTKGLAELFGACGRVTLENEFVPAGAIEEAVGETGRMLPDWPVLRVIQDKFVQKQVLAQAGVPVPSAWDRCSDYGFPLVAKSRFGGYDGKGTRRVEDPGGLQEIRQLVDERSWYIEEHVDFRRELAVMVYRAADGSAGVFPTMETVQSDHVCDLVFPSGTDASETAMQAVVAVGGVGLFGVELFELHDGRVLVNEIAPRPHNSGHYTLDWGGVSQFEQHVRLVMGWPCAEPSGLPTCMANLLGQPGAGDFRNGVAAALKAVPSAHVHWYGKAESRPGRKMGHINCVGDGCVDAANTARESFYRGWTES